jgi:hypothetical protein
MIGVMKRLLHLPLFNTCEMCAIDAVNAHLSTEARDILEKQIGAINYVQRHSNGKEANLYRMRWGKPHFNDKLRFPYSCEEESLANVTIVNEQQSRTIRSELILIYGRLFSIIFNYSPNDLSNNSGAIKASDVIIWFNPMQPRTVTKTRTDIPGANGWLDRFGMNVEVFPPLEHVSRKALLDRIGATLPPDYLMLTAQTEGARIGNCVVLGLSKIRKTVMPEANYNLLAEIGQRGVLAVKEGEASPVYFLDYEGAAPSIVGSTFEESLQRFVKQNER